MQLQRLTQTSICRQNVNIKSLGVRVAVISLYVSQRMLTGAHTHTNLKIFSTTLEWAQTKAVARGRGRGIFFTSSVP